MKCQNHWSSAPGYSANPQLQPSAFPLQQAPRQLREPMVADWASPDNAAQRAKLPVVVSSSKNMQVTQTALQTNSGQSFSVLVRPQVRRVESRVSSYSNWQAFSWIVNRRVEVKPCAVAIHTSGYATWISRHFPVFDCLIQICFFVQGRHILTTVKSAFKLCPAFGIVVDIQGAAFAYCILVLKHSATHCQRTWWRPNNHLNGGLPSFRCKEFKTP